MQSPEDGNKVGLLVHVLLSADAQTPSVAHKHANYSETTLPCRPARQARASISVSSNAISCGTTY